MRLFLPSHAPNSLREEYTKPDTKELFSSTSLNCSGISISLDISVSPLLIYRSYIDIIHDEAIILAFVLLNFDVAPGSCKAVVIPSAAGILTDLLFQINVTYSYICQMGSYSFTATKSASSGH